VICPWQSPFGPKLAAAQDTQQTLDGFKVASAAIDIPEIPNDPLLYAW
jgi:hypothetical protein